MQLRANWRIYTGNHPVQLLTEQANAPDQMHPTGCNDIGVVGARQTMGMQKCIVGTSQLLSTSYACQHFLPGKQAAREEETKTFSANA